MHASKSKRRRQSGHLDDRLMTAWAISGLAILIFMVFQGYATGMKAAGRHAVKHGQTVGTADHLHALGMSIVILILTLVLMYLAGVVLLMIGHVASWTYAFATKRRNRRHPDIHNK